MGLGPDGEKGPSPLETSSWLFHRLWNLWAPTGGPVGKGRGILSCEVCFLLATALPTSSRGKVSACGMKRVDLAYEFHFSKPPSPLSSPAASEGLHYLLAWMGSSPRAAGSWTGFVTTLSMEPHRLYLSFPEL